jgi:hypothetical protein
VLDVGSDEVLTGVNGEHGPHGSRSITSVEHWS